MSSLRSFLRFVFVEIPFCYNGRYSNRKTAGTLAALTVVYHAFVHPLTNEQLLALTGLIGAMFMFGIGKAQARIEKKIEKKIDEQGPR